jgi:hypothetical protein
MANNNVIESIFLSVKADTKELRSSLTEVTKALGKVEKNAKTASLGVSAAKPASDIASNAVGELTGKLKNLAAAYFSVRGAAQMVNSYLSNALNLGFTSQMIEENTEDINAFGEAVARNGGSVEGLKNSMSGLKDKMRSLYLEGDPSIAVPLARLGAGLFDNKTKASDQMLLLAEQMHGMSNDAAFTFGRRLGFDDATIRTLQQGRAAVEGLIAKYKELGVYTQKDFEAAKKLKNAMQDLKQSFVYLQTQTMRLLAPAIEFLTKKLTAVTRWMRDNEQFVRVFFVSMAAVITAVALPALAKLAAGWIAAFAPLLIIGGLIALLIDDFLVWKQGGISAFGEIYEVIEPIVTDFKQWISNTKEIRTTSVCGRRAMNGAILNKGEFWGIYSEVGQITTAQYNMGEYTYNTTTPIVEFDTLISIDVKQDAQITKYPAEEGGFTATAKVVSPIQLTIAGAKTELGDPESETAANFSGITEAIEKLEELRKSNKLVTVQTPYKVYLGMNIINFGYRHTAEAGANMLEATLTLQEVRIVKPQYTTIEVANPNYATGTEGSSTPTEKADLKSLLAKLLEYLRNL